MASGFKDPIKIKKQNPKDYPTNGKIPAWDYTCPQYDQSKGPVVSAGTNYGVGHKQPVGHKGSPKNNVDCLPMGKVKTMVVNEQE